MEKQKEAHMKVVRQDFDRLRVTILVTIGNHEWQRVYTYEPKIIGISLLGFGKDY